VANQRLRELLVEMGRVHSVRPPPVRMVVDNQDQSNALYVIPARLFLSILVSYVIALAEDIYGVNAIFPDTATNNSIQGMQLVDEFTKEACTQISLPCTDIV
jgi:hypothetical protein